MRHMRVTTAVMALAIVVFILLSVTLIYHYLFEKNTHAGEELEHEQLKQMQAYLENFMWDSQEISENISKTELHIDTSTNFDLPIQSHESISRLPTHGRHKKRFSNLLSSQPINKDDFDQDNAVLHPTSISEQELQLELPKPTESVHVTSTHMSKRKKQDGHLANRRINRFNKTRGEMARENVMSMKSNSVRCAIPRPKVVKVQDIHPHAYKRFVPSCIVLHRCERDTGCCDDPHSVCSPIRKKRITKFFFVVRLSVTDGIPAVEAQRKIDGLRFVNHTECGCRRRRLHPVDMGRVSVAPLGASQWGNAGSLMLLGFILFALVLR